MVTIHKEAAWSLFSWLSSPGASLKRANSVISGWLILCAWFTLLFKALQSESGSVKFVAQVFCLPRLRPGMGRAESSRELANTFVRIWGLCVCAMCLALATCHLARLRHRHTQCAVCVCVCARVLTAKLLAHWTSFVFGFCSTKTSQAAADRGSPESRPLSFSHFQWATMRMADTLNRLRVLPVPCTEPTSWANSWPVRSVVFATWTGADGRFFSLQLATLLVQCVFFCSVCCLFKREGKAPRRTWSWS